jgi:hypothetical protein
VRLIICTTGKNRWQDALLKRFSCPADYILRHVENEEDTRQYIRAVKTVFRFEENVEVGKFVHSGPSAARELDLLIYSDGGVSWRLSAIYGSTGKTASPSSSRSERCPNTKNAV